MMLQSYTLLHKTSGNENISVLNFIKSNNLKVDGYKNSVRTASLPNLVTILSFFGNGNIALSDYFRNFAAEIKTLRL